MLIAITDPPDSKTLIVYSQSKEPWEIAGIGQMVSVQGTMEKYEVAMLLAKKTLSS